MSVHALRVPFPHPSSHHIPQTLEEDRWGQASGSPGQALVNQYLAEELCVQEVQGPRFRCSSRTYANIPNPCPMVSPLPPCCGCGLPLGGPSADRFGALLPQMSRVLAQESTSQSQRRPEVGQELGEETVTYPQGLSDQGLSRGQILVSELGGSRSPPCPGHGVQGIEPRCWGEGDLETRGTFGKAARM